MDKNCFIALEGRESMPKVSAGMPPWNYAAIIQYADPPAQPADSNASTKELKVEEALTEGIMIRNKKQMYRVASGKNWFTIFPEGLTVASFDDPMYWKRKTLKDSSGRIQFMIGILRHVCWLDVSGKFQTVTLSQDTTYEIVLHVKLGHDRKDGFDAPVYFKITLPDGCRVQSEKNFNQLPRGSWEDVPLHEFNMSIKNVGEVHFCIYEHGGTWKSGIELGGVSFKPKTTDHNATTTDQSSDQQQQQQNEAGSGQEEITSGRSEGQRPNNAEPSSEHLPVQDQPAESAEQNAAALPAP